jgi:hypothetical protein
VESAIEETTADHVRLPNSSQETLNPARRASEPVPPVAPDSTEVPVASEGGSEEEFSRLEIQQRKDPPRHSDCEKS